jgi:hypothetical protein
MALARGRDAMAIWRDLVDDHDFPAQYASVRRFVITLRGQRPAEAHPVIVTALPGGGASGKSHPLTRGGSSDFREWAFMFPTLTLRPISRPGCAH